MLSDYLMHPQTMMQYWLLYSLICLPLTILVVLIIPSRLRKRPLIPFLFFYVLSASIVVFGLLISLIFVTVLRFQKPPRRNKKTVLTADYPDFQKAPTSQFISYGESSGFKIITDASFSKSTRQKLLWSINQYQTAGANKINSAALGDELDEVRLYAYSMIEKQEREHQKQIKNYLHHLAKTKNPKIAAQYKKQIASILWDSIYKYLVTNENLIVTLNKIEGYAKQAFEQLPDDLELPIILAKVELKKSNISAAKEWLNLAAKNQAPEYKIVSLLAEIEFIEKNYSEIKNVFTGDSNIGIDNLQAVQAMWVKNV